MSEEKREPVVIKPGVPLSPEKRAQLAKENEEATKQAQAQAQEQIQRDIAQGRQPGAAAIIGDVASSIGRKLENDEFSVVVDERGNHVPPRPVSSEE